MSDEIIHVIDGDASVREAAGLALRSAGLSYQTYISLHVFLANLPRQPGGCIVADRDLSCEGVPDLISELRAHHVVLPLIVMSGVATVRTAIAAMRAGAVDVVEKPLDAADLLDAVQRALQHSRRQIEELDERSVIAARLESLSARERQVLEALVAGRPNKIIAYELGISIRTIEIYRANVMTKMEAASLPELVRMAVMGRSGAAPQGGSGLISGTAARRSS